MWCSNKPLLPLSFIVCLTTYNCRFLGRKRSTRYHLVPLTSTVPFINGGLALGFLRRFLKRAKLLLYSHSVPFHYQ